MKAKELREDIGSNLGDTDKKVTFDLTQTRVDIPIIQVMESGKHIYHIYIYVYIYIYHML